jgi:hypothetical protein
MPKSIKVAVAGFGVSIDSLNIMYNITGDSALIPAANACGQVAFGLTQVQLLSGYTVYLPDNAANVYVISASGVCVGTIAGIAVPA